MRRLIALQVIVVSLGCLIPMPGRAELSSPEAVRGEGYSVVGATSSELEVIAAVSTEFREKDLELPGKLDVVFSEKPDDCFGYAGIYAFGKEQVTLCRPRGGSWKTLRKLVRHELGHAWDDHNMTDRMRKHYMSKIGKKGKWLDERLPHDDRAGERFANTVAGLIQGTLDRERFDDLIGPR
jgi:hypothetical protein